MIPHTNHMEFLWELASFRRLSEAPGLWLWASKEMEKWEREAIGSFMFLAIRVGLVHGKIRAKNTIWLFNIAMV